MSDVAIRVEGLSKQYRIGARQEKNKTLCETLTDALASPFRLAGKLLRGQATGAANQDETVWALKDVSFEVKQGEVLGIIGKNGAGKSTLLKLLSRITEPTQGRAEIYGTVGSLLEIGTGFHPELTGRENIYLNGGILGMTKKEIDKKFDEIVDFAEIEKFIETPVKRYSSGMYVRLAFAVAAHLEPEILIIDEVLAVGDIGFQKKCLGKMHDVAGAGRTVLFVSHNMGAIKSLCNRCILIENGGVQMQGSPDNVISLYASRFQDVLLEGSADRIEADRHQLFAGITGFFLHPKDSRRDLSLLCGDTVKIEFDIEAPKSISQVTSGIQIVTMMGDPVITMSSKVQNVPSIVGLSRFWRVVCDMGRLPLNAGRYFVHVHIGCGGRDVAKFSNAFSLTVQEHDVFGWGKSLPGEKPWGSMYWAPQWNIRPVD